MTTEEQGFLAAIRANPADDTARLVYADWLQENGQEARAEFIRVQVELAKIDPRASLLDHVKFDALTRRERNLWNAENNVRTWWPVGNPPLSVRINSSPANEFEADRFALIRRGFIESVRCPAADWLAHGDAIRAAHPVTKVTPTTPMPFEGDEDECWFPGDPAGSRFAWVDIQAALMAADGANLFDGDHQLALKLRWPGISFDLPP